MKSQARSHITRTASWLPPVENWPSRDSESTDEELPYGWEQALDSRGKPYYINHVNKTTTYVAPEGFSCESPPAPRDVVLERDAELGFGFVAGSEKPVLVRFVTDNSPSVGKLEPGDQILCVNGEDVSTAAREHVISAVRACSEKVTLRVCQPARSGNLTRRSAFLSAAKRARLRARPPRVRFADSVQLNGAPMYPPSAFSLGDLCLPPMANVLKVFLENGQTKSFKYDATTTVADVVTSLKDKLCIVAEEHFSLVVEHVKSLRRNKLTLLDPKESLARVRVFE
ncbi:jg22150 [Pararge aegeria aegeria]|uniref:Jg22150 protein n=1 Tax=Pararge aegeria aegeria TaxID=348720 RepID=A0A8S4SGH5_9NEOP|nr:jg22150 [Pararge aegeria aegeria]